MLQVVEDPFSSGSLGDTVEPSIIEDDPFADDFGGGEFDDDFGDGEFDEDFGGGQFDEADGPSASTIGWLSVLFGAGYLALSRLFDKRHLAGAATPFVVAGHIALITGISALADDLRDGRGRHRPSSSPVSLVARLGARQRPPADHDHRCGRDRARGADRPRRRDGGRQRHRLRHRAVRPRGGDRWGWPRCCTSSTGEPPQTTPGPSSFPRLGPGGQAGEHRTGRHGGRTLGRAARRWRRRALGGTDPPAAPPDPGPGRRSPPSRGPPPPAAGLRSRARRRPPDPRLAPPLRPPPPPPAPEPPAAPAAVAPPQPPAAEPPRRAPPTEGPPAADRRLPADRRPDAPPASARLAIARRADAGGAEPGQRPLTTSTISGRPRWGSGPPRRRRPAGRPSWPGPCPCRPTRWRRRGPSSCPGGAVTPAM